MSAMGTFLGMLGGFGGLAVVAVLFSKIFGGDIKIREAVSKMFKKKSNEQIMEVNNERKDIAAKVIASEKIAEEKKQKIKEIQVKAKKEILETLEKDDLQELVMESDELWGK